MRCSLNRELLNGLLCYTAEIFKSGGETASHTLLVHFSESSEDSTAIRRFEILKQMLKAGQFSEIDANQIKIIGEYQMFSKIKAEEAFEKKALEEKMKKHRL